MNYPTMKQWLDQQAKSDQQQTSQTYTYNLAPVILNQSTSGVRQLVDTGLFYGGWIVIKNESPWDIQVIQGGVNRTVKAQFADKMQTFQRIIYILPSQLLPQGSPSSRIDIEVFPLGEPYGYYPHPLARQSAPVSASVQFGYSTTITELSGVGPLQMINIFNPTNSGKNYVFYSILGTITTGTAATQILIQILAGPDVAFANPLTVFPHDTNSPVSLAHATSLSGSAPANTVLTAPSNIVVQVGQPAQSLQNGDLATLHQGQNLIVIANTSTQQLTENISWWEQ